MFWQHGAQKLFGFFGGAPAAPFTLLWFAGVVEFAGAIAIAVGFLTRPFAFLLAADMAILYLTQYLPLGFPPILNRDGEVACQLFLIAALLVFTGPERFSVEGVLKKSPAVSPPDYNSEAQYSMILSVFRILVGLLFVQHGMQKLFGMLGEASEPFLALRWFAGIIEFFGGLAITFGLFTRPIAFLACGQMAVAYFLNHIPRGFWPIENVGERAVLFCYIFLFLVAAGPGNFSLDSLLGRKTVTAKEPAVSRS